ncbi:MAG: hypothetical protein ACRD2X_20640 [Vicinamibacteraceae bacterium]
MNTIELYRELSQTVELSRLSTADLEVLGVAGLYVLAVIWLGRLWLTRHNARRRRQLARGLAFMDGVTGLLRVVVLVVVGVLIALARAAGRPPYYRW